MRLFPFLHSSHPFGQGDDIIAKLGRQEPDQWVEDRPQGGQNVEIPFYIRALEMEFPDEKLEDCQISHYKSIVLPIKTWPCSHHFRCATSFFESRSYPRVGISLVRMVCNPKAKGLIIRCSPGACGNSTASKAQGEVMAKGTDMPVLPLVPLVMLSVALGPESL